LNIISFLPSFFSTKISYGALTAGWISTLLISSFFIVNILILIWLCAKKKTLLKIIISFNIILCSLFAAELIFLFPGSIISDNICTFIIDNMNEKNFSDFQKVLPVELYNITESCIIHNGNLSSNLSLPSKIYFLDDLSNNVSFLANETNLVNITNAINYINNKSHYINEILNDPTIDLDDNIGKYSLINLNKMSDSNVR